MLALASWLAIQYPVADRAEECAVETDPALPLAPVALQGLRLRYGIMRLLDQNWLPYFL